MRSPTSPSMPKQLSYHASEPQLLYGCAAGLSPMGIQLKAKLDHPSWSTKPQKLPAASLKGCSSSQGEQGGLREQLCRMLPAGDTATQARQFILPHLCQFGPLWGCYTNQVTNMIRVKNNLLHKTNRKLWWLFLTQIFFADVLCSSALRVVVWQN